MIFHFTQNYIDSLTPRHISDSCSQLIKNKHYITVENSDILQKIKDSILKCGSETQKDLLKTKTLAPTSLQKKYLTTFTPTIDTPYDWFYWMVSKPGYLIMENSHHEWNAYRNIIEIYKSDPYFKTLFVDLKKAFLEYRIEPRNGGGFHGLVKAKNQITNDPAEGEKYVNFKTVMLFDRDTDNETSYDHEKNDLFKHCCRKTSSRLTLTDIYSLNQPRVAWHMWYKRSIENYFDDESYSRLGIGPIKPDHRGRDYFKIDDETTKKFRKDSLEHLASKMSRSRMEKGLKMFYCQEASKNISEMQLFLLKLVRIM